jgi:hypothetical protein
LARFKDASVAKKGLMLDELKSKVQQDPEKGLPA